MCAQAKMKKILLYSVITMRLSFEPATLDWNMGDVSIPVVQNTMEGLYQTDEKNSVFAVQAEGMPKEIKSNMWKIVLKKNLKWSDGTAVTAQNYVDSWERLKNPKTASDYAYLLQDVKSARALDERTIEIEGTNKSLNPALFTHWVTYPIQKEKIDRLGVKWTKDAAHIAVNGPYTIAEHIPEVSFKLSANPYYRKKPATNQINALILPNDETAFRLYEEGRIDILFEPTTLDKTFLNKRKDYFTIASPILVYLGFNTKTLGSEQRCAISRAIDREELIKVLQIKHNPTKTMIPHQKFISSDFTAPKNIFPNNYSLGFYIKGANQLLVEQLQNQLKKKLNLNAKLQPFEVKSYWKKLEQEPMDIFLNSFNPGTWDKSFYFRLLSSSNIQNRGKYASAEYDEWVKNPTETNTKKIESLLSKDCPIAPLYFRSYEYLIQPKVKNVRMNPMPSFFLENAQN